jgi:hydrogenase small subunit
LNILEKIHIVWLQGQGCSGCTISLTNATNPNLIDVLTGFIPQVSGISLDFHPTIMAPWGKDAVNILKMAERKDIDPFVLIVEGSIPNEEIAKRTGGFWCAVGEENGQLLTLNDWISRLSGKAAAIVAAGSCASYGGVRHGAPNPTGAKGVLDFLGRNWKSILGLPVICIPGCPVQGDHLLKTLGYAVLAVRGHLPPPELDEHHRPKFIFSDLAHDICPRAGFYTSGRYSNEFGEPYCMSLLGCKGIITHCDVPKRGFVDGIGGCTTLGAPCIGCTEPEFPDKPFSPFLEKAPASAFASDALKGFKGHISAGLKRAYRREI